LFLFDTPATKLPERYFNHTGPCRDNAEKRELTFIQHVVFSHKGVERRPDSSISSVQRKVVRTFTYFRRCSDFGNSTPEVRLYLTALVGSTVQEKGMVQTPGGTKINTQQASPLKDESSCTANADRPT